MCRLYNAKYQHPIPFQQVYSTSHHPPLVFIPEHEASDGCPAYKKYMTAGGRLLLNMAGLLAQENLILNEILSAAEEPNFNKILLSQKYQARTACFCPRPQT
jgi:hypothetical protein